MLIIQIIRKFSILPSQQSFTTIYPIYDYCIHHLLEPRIKYKKLMTDYDAILLSAKLRHEHGMPESAHCITPQILGEYFKPIIALEYEAAEMKYRRLKNKFKYITSPNQHIIDTHVALQRLKTAKTSLINCILQFPNTLMRDFGCDLSINKVVSSNNFQSFSKILNSQILHATNLITNLGYGHSEYQQILLEDEIYNYLCNQKMGTDETNTTPTSDLHVMTLPDWVKMPIIEGCGLANYSSDVANNHLLPVTDNQDFLKTDTEGWNEAKKLFTINKNTLCLNPNPLSVYAAYFTKMASQINDPENGVNKAPKLKWVDQGFFTVANLYRNYYVAELYSDYNTQNYSQDLNLLRLHKYLKENGIEIGSARIPYQTRSATLFVACHNYESSRISFQNSINIITGLYKHLGVSSSDFRIVEAPLAEYELADAYRINIQVGVSLQTLKMAFIENASGWPDDHNLDTMLSDKDTKIYVNLGYLAYIGDYVSQRLAMLGKYCIDEEDINDKSNAPNAQNKIGKSSVAITPQKLFFIHGIYGEICNIPLLTKILNVRSNNL